MTKSIFFKVCRGWLLGTGLVLGLLALTLWVKGEASHAVQISGFLTLLLMCFYRYSSYRWWVKGLLTVVFMLVVSLVLHLMNWSWEVSLTSSHLLVLCPLFLVLAGLTQLVLTTTDRT